MHKIFRVVFYLDFRLTIAQQCLFTADTLAIEVL